MLTSYPSTYLSDIERMLRKILCEEESSLDRAAMEIANQIENDRLIYVYGPGGHSNLAAQEVFFRAGGLAYVSAVLDEGTLLSNGALRSVSIERLPGYGKAVIAEQGLSEGDMLILVSAYGINSALIDAALEARRRGIKLIGLNSHAYALNTPAEHPARHTSKQNLQDLVDVAIDTKVPFGDAFVEIPDVGQSVGPASTFASCFALNCLVVETVAKLVERGITAPIWRSVNTSDGESRNAELIVRLKGRIRWL